MSRTRSDAPFLVGLGILGGSYVLLIAAMIVADALFSSPGNVLAALRGEDVGTIIYSS